MSRKKIRNNFRRKVEGITDYKKRLKLLVSGKTRLVIRKSLKHIRAQFVEYNEKGDKILVSGDSRELLKLNWKTSTSNVPAAYLIGLIVGKKALAKGIKEAIVDIGLNPSIKGNRLYAVVKGVIDAGVKIPCSKEVLPSEDRINGKHISNDLQKQIEEVKKKIA